MKRMYVFLGSLLLLLTIAVLSGRTPLFAALPAQNPTATPTPAPEEEIVAEPTVADLLARLESLEAAVADLYAAHKASHALSYEQVNAVNTAIYLLDSVGLHELDTQLAVDGVINPGDSGKVAQIARLLMTVTWPDELAAHAVDTQEMLAALAAALADDDLETAKAVMLTGHATYHVFAQLAQDWVLATAETTLSDAPGQANRVNTAIYLLDGADLHALDVRLNEEGEILPGDGGQVIQVARLLLTVDWPEALVEDAAALYETLSALATALADDDLENAQPLATLAHEQQHDLSHHAQGWLTEQMGDAGHGDHSHDDHDHDDSHGDEHSDEEKPAEDSHSHGG